MKSNSTGANAERDVLAARAIEDILEAERDAQAAVTTCQQAGSKVLEAASEQARTIFDRAQVRIVALHGRMAKKLEGCAAALREQRKKTAAEAVKRLSDPARLRVALERVAAQMTTEAAALDVA